MEQEKIQDSKKEHPEQQKPKQEKKQEPKKYTLKSVTLEITKLENARNTKIEKIEELNEQLKQDDEKLAELNGIFKNLYLESILKKIENSWLKQGKLSTDQIDKMIQLGGQIGDKIDLLDVDEMTQAVNLVCEEHKNTAVEETSTEAAETEDKKKNE